MDGERSDRVLLSLGEHDGALEKAPVAAWDPGKCIPGVANRGGPSAPGERGGVHGRQAFHQRAERLALAPGGTPPVPTATMMERGFAGFRASRGSMTRTCESIIWSVVGLASSSFAAAAPQAWTQLASANSGVGGDAASRFAALSGDGAVCAFSSAATNLVPGDTNSVEDVFVRVLAAAAPERVSLSSAGVQADGASFFPALSADGRFVAFQSYATTLVAGDTNGRVDVFVRDRLLGATERVSVSSSGAQGVHPPVFLQPFERGQALSADGRFVVFVSLHSNLVANDTNATYDVFLRDRALGTTSRINVGPGGVEANAQSWQPAISADGEFVAFASGASNLVGSDFNAASDVFVVERRTGALELASVALGGGVGVLGAGRPSLSGDGRFVSFVGTSPDWVPGDFNALDDSFVRDRASGVTERVSVEGGGLESLAPTMSAELSADGRFAVFTCASDLLVPGDADQRYDVFVRDRLARTTVLVSLNDSDVNIPAHAEHGVLSADGRFVAFHSNAAYAAGDANQVEADVFVRDTFGVGPASFCAPRPSSGGCAARSALVGAASLASTAPLSVELSAAGNQRSAAFFYGFAPASAPWLGGVLCVAPPLRRTPPRSTGGAPPPADDCSGAASFDLRAHLAAGLDPALAAGADVYGQWFVRDPQAAPGASSFSDALYLRLLP
jgi:Tol biopolymer transport system component